MTKQEFSKFAMALKTLFPKETILPNELAMRMWYKELCDIQYEVAEIALEKWVQTNKWSPSIAEIREMAASVSSPDMPDWSEAWESVCKAIRRFGYNRQREGLESLDKLTREVVDRLGYKYLCMSENHASDRANFRMIYENLSKREQTKHQIALPLHEAIGRMQIEQKNGMLMIGEKEKYHD